MILEGRQLCQIDLKIRSQDSMDMPSIFDD
jgi:hypothetical protein